MSRIPATFARLTAEGRTGLIAYVTAGFPTPDETPDLVRALVDGGADIIELGVPFSDPLADGATVQRANQVALEHGVSLGDVLAMVRELRAGGLPAPLIAMGYYNPVLAYGLERFAEDAAASGLDGIIPVDVPPEEGGPLAAALAARGLDVIFLVAPTSPDERIAKIAGMASGFLYCVSLAGVTGARGELPAGLPDFVARVRRHTTLPLAVGFGVSRREHVARIGELCEAAVIGSAIIESIEAAPAGQRAARVRAFVADVTATAPASPA